MPRGILRKDGNAFSSNSFHIFDSASSDRLNHLLHELTMLRVKSWHVKDILCSPRDEGHQQQREILFHEETFQRLPELPPRFFNARLF